MSIFGRSQVVQVRVHKESAPTGPVKFAIETQFFPAMRGMMSLRVPPPSTIQTMIFPAMRGVMSLKTSDHPVNFVSLSGKVTV